MGVEKRERERGKKIIEFFSRLNLNNRHFIKIFHRKEMKGLGGTGSPKRKRGM